MEAFQRGYVRAIAAASGAVVSGEPEVDEGVDIELTHRSTSHLIEAARVEVQLKSTHREPTEAGLSVQLRRKRYDYLRTADPTTHKILVVMSVPRVQDRWVHATSRRLKIRHASYWVNLAGLPATAAAQPTVVAPLTQVFDDAALCMIMERIGQGGAP